MESLRAKAQARSALRAQTAARNRQLREELRDVGLNYFDMHTPETYHLADTLLPDEKIHAAVRGRVEPGTSSLIIVTDRRVVWIDQIPFYTDMEEYNFQTVGGIGFEMGQWSGLITLYTPNGPLSIYTNNLTAAKRFVTCIEEEAIDTTNSRRVPLAS